MASKPFLQCFRQTYRSGFAALHLQPNRSFSSTAASQEGAQGEVPKEQPFYRAPDPFLVTSPRLERRLIRAGKFPVGSRRRRAALQNSPNISFPQLPYQCFQEARKIILEDRAEKLKQIETERGRLERLRATTPEDDAGKAQKQTRIKSMEKHLEELKILADINDPMTKRRFEDGMGDMDKPIYRFLADRKWREYRRAILVQRITQMKVVPDVLAHIDPIVDVKLSFGRKSVQPGEFVNSRASTVAPDLQIQSFAKDAKLVTIAVVDPDVPNLETDAFDHRCHFLAINVPISPTEISVSLDKLAPESQVILPWLAPYALKGSPYHRISILIMEQKDQKSLDYNVAQKKVEREGFRLRSFETRHQLKPIGAHLFRTHWDEDMLDVMTGLGVEGIDIELKRKRVEPLPYKRRNPASFR
ncbi:mitochondrial 54S ribosomal protein YmL35 [Ophidiomyces ophidiicola]|nr:mitochondrial 54S ribosomal protein YmL35 [Ophidiomyces ophidiicola]